MPLDRRFGGFDHRPHLTWCEIAVRDGFLVLDGLFNLPLQLAFDE